MTADHRAFMIWLTDMLARGGWTSLGQAAKKVMTLDARGVSVEQPRLGIDKSTLSRWLAGQHLPAETSLRMMLERLNACIEQRRQSMADTPGGRPALITPSCIEEGIQLLEAANAASENSRHPHHRSSREILEELIEVASDLERSSDRYDRLHAELETLREAAENERLNTQDLLSALRARIRLSEKELARAKAEVEHLRAKNEALASQWEKYRRAGEQKSAGVASGFEVPLNSAPHESGDATRGVAATNVADPGAPYDHTDGARGAQESECSEEQDHPQPHGREEVESQQPAALLVRSRIAAGVLSAGLTALGFSVAASIAAAGPVVLMSGAWAFWFGMPWGEVRHQSGKSFAIALFIAACLILSCAFMVAPAYLARGDDGGLAGGCFISVSGVVGSCVLLSNYPVVMEWLPKAVGVY
ncbi:hypothetical protein JHN59_03470 [Streptomyces sp. MBT49]|uniref:hypothetical protein n=1 Tax=Streptomyces sp. MBT49 TaxID=1488380 RepID=UPI001909E3B1|nr:hypothetical protein [Streptomyces sp. MBT49]MBK3623911.1 hypothetical protein [Streptomyces sp. MBT49]